ncbi:iron-containing alcohol dehydrogenase [Vibrio sp. ZSDZ34]|uniref:Iron-containing alcohol dehydrogenase n=1 Tax=Vibrio gelatinilyticus TaxID=2893468 RepID=A0A9X1WBR1_9VIBR|nr:iron-containing alcohol dehydrogenase [Vibrio gelatinilyticus]MCJ2377643.1 iron-containing alcohol dehydrogenase [Vibrio gelatinilyticus]
MVFALNLPKLSLSGVGAVEESIEALANKSLSHPLIVTDSNLAEMGLLDGLYAALDQKKIPYTVFKNVTPNPTAELVRAGVKCFNDNDCDSFIAVGGGSPIDCAKAIRIVQSNGGDIVDYNGVGLVKNDGAFFIAINTTAGTAAEMTSNSVITDTENKIKMVIVDGKQIPDIAVNDPSLMVGLPAHVTASTGMDALTHAIESIVTPGANTLTKPMALEAVRLISQWLPVAVQDGSNIEARGKLADAQFLAGMSFNSAGLGAVHALAHQPGATHDLPHGVCNAILLPKVCKFNAEGEPQAFRSIAEAMGADTSQLNDYEAAMMAVEKIEFLSSLVDIPLGLSTLGIKESDLQGWVKPAMNDVCMGGNPRVMSEESVLEMYKSAL